MAVLAFTDLGVRGEQEPQVSMLAFVDLESRIPQDHPLETEHGLGTAAPAMRTRGQRRTYRPPRQPPTLPPARHVDQLWWHNVRVASCRQLTLNATKQLEK